MHILFSNISLSKLNKPTIIEAKEHIFSKLHAYLNTVNHLVRVWRERSCQRRELGQLSSYQLKDIGVNREDVINEASKPFWKK